MGRVFVCYSEKHPFVGDDGDTECVRCGLDRDDPDHTETEAEEADAEAVRRG